MFYFRRGLTSLFNDYLPRLSPTHKKPDLKPKDIGLLGIIELMIGIIVILIMNSDMILSLVVFNLFYSLKYIGVCDVCGNVYFKGKLFKHQCPGPEKN